jgi:hypothetical protein
MLFAAVLVAASATSSMGGSPASAPPTPTASPAVIGTGDPRSEGEGPGLRGSPVLIALGVVGIGLLAAAGTVVYVRLRRTT